jgi:integrase
MAVRWKKYYSACKGKRAEGDRYGRVTGGIKCEGKRGRHCPEGVLRDCGAWAIEFRDSDGRWLSKIFPEITSKTIALEYLHTIKTDIRRGIFNLPTRKEIPNLSEYCEKYLELYKGAKETTRTSKERAVNVLVRYLGSYRLDKITAFIVEKFRVERREKDLVKDSSINVDVAILSSILNMAVKSGILDKNPCKDVKRLKESQSRDRILSSDEIALLLDGLRGKDRLMIMTGLFTGMRIIEVLSLKWQDIDFAKGIITFIQSKTGKIVTIPLSSYLANELLNYREGCLFETDSVFETRKLTKVLLSSHSGHFSLLFKSLGISNFTFHNLRHTFTSLHGELGTGAITTKEMLGHSNLDMTLRYSHIGLDSKRQAIDTLTNYITNAKAKILTGNA